MDDNYLFLTRQNDFIKRFKIIADIKLAENKFVLLSYDYILKSICITKIIFNQITNEDLTVYEILKNNPHPNIEKILDIIKYPDFYIIVIEYIDGDNLTKYIKCNNKIMNNIYYDLLKGLKHLNKLNIIHGDMKLENIMYANNTAIIIDFEYSKKTDYYYYDGNSFGSLNYISPEGYELNVYSQKSDIWGLGVIFYKLITGRFPYNLDNISFSARKCFKSIDLNYLDKFKYDIINNVKKMLVFIDRHRYI